MAELSKFTPKNSMIVEFILKCPYEKIILCKYERYKANI